MKEKKIEKPVESDSIINKQPKRDEKSYLI